MAAQISLCINRTKYFCDWRLRLQYYRWGSRGFSKTMSCQSRIYPGGGHKPLRQSCSTLTSQKKGFFGWYRPLCTGSSGSCLNPAAIVVALLAMVAVVDSFYCCCFGWKVIIQPPKDFGNTKIIWVLIRLIYRLIWLFHAWICREEKKINLSSLNEFKITSYSTD